MTTRNSFKRKVIFFGLVLFISISLISTGFAAWVMTSRGESESEGNVSVGVVEGAQIKIDSVTLSTTNIIFDTLADDNSGRVRHKEGTPGESMKVKIDFTINQSKFVGNVIVRFVVPTQIQDAIDGGYIAVEAESDSAKLLTDDKTSGGLTFNLSNEDRLGVYTNSVTFEFKWGTKFNSQNPGVYYDTDEAGLAVSDAEVMKTLETFRAIVYGYETELANKYAAIEAAQDDSAKEAAINAKNELIASKTELPKFVVYIIANPM